tara:strand:+ start:1302 stop:1706 length:405 start_codon:yes stop_codon:yes gene_type:complete
MERINNNFKISNLLVLLLLIFISCTSSDYTSTQNREYNLYSQLMCPVCNGQTISESKASIAEDMKEYISNQVREGKTDKEILKYFEERYGKEILASPPPEGFNLIVWIMPIIVILIALSMLFFGLNKTIKRVQN